MNWLFNSSESPEKLSATITGVIISLSSVIILFASHHGVTVTTEQVQEGAAQLGVAVGAIWAVVGIIRKGVNIFRK